MRNIIGFICTILLMPHGAFSMDICIQKKLDENDAAPLVGYLTICANFGSDAYVKLAQLYLEGIGFQKNVRLANFYFLKAAERHNPVALKALGDSFYSGDGFEKSEDLALDYYLKADRVGYLPATLNAAIVYKDRYLKNKSIMDKNAAIKLLTRYMRKIHDAQWKNAAQHIMKQLDSK
jgi:TPR repeat protein